MGDVNGNPLSFAIFAYLESDIGFAEEAEELELAGLAEAAFTVISFPTMTWVYPGVLLVETVFFTVEESMTSSPVF